MKFGAWHPLAAAADHVPAGPGVLQVRVCEGLVRYPRGKSAMIFYAGAAEVRALASALARTHAGAPWLCRASVGPCADPAAAAARLLAEFSERFGECPKIPVLGDMADR